MTKTRFASAGLVFAGVALLVALQMRSLMRLRAENAALRHEHGELRAENDRVSPNCRGK